MRKNKQTGFTLIEVLVVVAIILILSSVGYLSWRDFASRNLLDLESQKIVNLLRETQNFSISAKNGSQYGVHFSAGEYVFFRGASLAGAEEVIKTNEVSNKLDIFYIDFSGTENRNEVVFDKLQGTTSNYGTVKIKIKDSNQEESISVNSEGRIGLYELGTAGNPPTRFSLLSPLKGTIVNSVNPYLSWEQSIDPDGGEIKYDVWYSSDPAYSSSSLNILPNLTTNNTSQENFVNYTRNYWKVRAVDEEGYITWSNQGDWYVDVASSTPPNAFSLLSPPDGYLENSTLRPTFDWEDTSDPDGDGLSYTLWYSLDQNFNTKEEVSLIGHSFYTIPADKELANNEIYYWQVKAVDVGGSETWATDNQGNIQTWHLATQVNSAPAPFSLLAPANDSIINTVNPAFDWEDAVDPDGDSVSYNLLVDDDLDFSSPVLDKTSLTASQYQVAPGEELTNNETYYWKVKAIDSQGAERWSTQQDWKFNINILPGSFSLIAPANLAVVDSVLPLFDWQDSIDPGDVISYTLLVDDQADFSSPLINKTGISGSQYQTLPADNLQNSQTYYWKVKAVDGAGNETWSNEQNWSFNIQVQNCDWYVDGTRPQSGNGKSLLQAFKTIKEARNKLDRGDTVCLANYVYQETVDLNNSHSGSAADYTEFVNLEGHNNVVIDGDAYAFRLNTSDYIRLKGLKLTSSSSAGIYITNGADHNLFEQLDIYGNNYGIYAARGSNNSIFQVVVRDSSSYGIYMLNNTAQNNIITDSEINNNNSAAGIFLNGTSGIKILNNKISANQEGVVMVDTQTTEISNNIISQNNNYGIESDDDSAPLVYNNTIASNGYWGAVFDYSTDVVFYRNVIYKNDSGLYLYGSKGNATHYYNNTIVNNNWYGIDANIFSNQTKLRNNLVTNNTFGFSVYLGGANLNNDYNNIFDNSFNYWALGIFYQGANPLSENPLYQNYAADDYRLQAGSPCIHRGDPSSVYNNPDGSRSDIGALPFNQ